MEDPTVFDPSKHADLLPQFAEIHRKCITSDFTIATFLPPLKDDRVEQYWRTRAAEVQAGTRTIIFMRAAPPSDPFDATPAPPGSSVAGVVMLAKPIAETGPMRGLVEKLLVDPSYRKMGIGKKLMAKLEEVARKSSRWLLLLDTEEGSPAEYVYPKLGYIKYGKVPNYSISPQDASYRHEIFFYKDLLLGTRFASPEQTVADVKTGADKKSIADVKN